MSRQPRFTLPGIPQHVIQRDNNREPCFYAEQDYWRYLYDLKEAATHNQAAIHAYVLMTNHVHRLVTPGQPYSITPMMQDLGRQYVRYVNWVTMHNNVTILVENYFACLMDHRQIQAIREALNQDLVLGREDFKDKIERMTKRQVRPGQPGRPRVEEAQAVYYVL
jgi:REP element-mobilizing transposase RayT